MPTPEKCVRCGYEDHGNGQDGKCPVCLAPSPTEASLEKETSEHLLMVAKTCKDDYFIEQTLEALAQAERRGIERVLEAVEDTHGCDFPCNGQRGAIDAINALLTPTDPAV